MGGKRGERDRGFDEVEEAADDASVVRRSVRTRFATIPCRTPAVKEFHGR